MAAAKAPPGSKVLLQGLDLLRLLAQANGPVSATSLAQTTGQHPSTVSRLLTGLVKAGYLRKPDYHSYSVDLGLVTLLGRVRQHFPIATEPRLALIEAARRLPGMRLSLATLHGHQLVYWLAVDAGQEPVDLISGGFPLHLSSIALRILLDRPKAEALELLALSRRWYGWSQPTAAVPDSEAGVLAAARQRLDGACLVLNGWQSPGTVTAGLPIRSPDGRPLILAMSGPTPRTQAARILAEVRTTVEAALNPGATP